MQVSKSAMPFIELKLLPLCPEGTTIVIFFEIAIENKLSNKDKRVLLLTKTSKGRQITFILNLLLSSIIIFKAYSISDINPLPKSLKAFIQYK